MKKEFDIVTIGTMAYDMILRTVDASLFTRDTTLLQEVGLSSGGGALISAIIAQRLGCKTALIGKTTKDPFGDYLLHIVRDAGVNCAGIKVSETDSMSLTFALVKPDGSRHFLSKQGSNNSTLCLQDFDLDIVRKAEIVCYGSFLYLQTLDMGDITTVFMTAKESGALTVADIASDAFLQGTQTVFRNFPYLDFFIPSYTEAKYLTNESDPVRMAAVLRQKGCQNVIIKLGGDGCYVDNGKVSGTVPTFNNVKAVDTTGAGDNFVGGFLTALHDGLDLIEASRFANAVASISVSGVGGIAAVQNKQQVLDLLHSEPNFS